MNKIDTNNLIIDFGKYKGQLWTRVPVSYLQWLLNQKDDNIKYKKQFDYDKKIAKSELNRRGTNLQHDVEITPHAVDKASLRVRKIWHQTCNENEGIYTWLSRIAGQAIAEKGKNEIIRYLGIKFIFKIGNNYPILKTVIPLKEL
jgi:hypothetical protein